MNDPDDGLEHVASASSAFPLNPKLKSIEKPSISAKQLADAIVAGDRRALAQGITLVESRNPEDQALALDLLDHCQAQAGGSFRIAISGAPGVGKSTLINALGSHLIELGEKLAVLAVDPTSDRSGGSILGDKTRMTQLSTAPEAFIRPSPSSGRTGGVARGTRAAIALCEAAGYSTVIVETVGVGQGETAARHMTDCFVLLALAGAGDELQGIKRGIVEISDVVAVTKADGENKARADLALSVIRNALRLFPTQDSGWRPQALACSAITGSGLTDLWETVLRYRSHVQAGGWMQEERGRQRSRWLRDELSDRMLEALQSDKANAAALEAAESEVIAGRVHPYRAADELFRGLFRAT